MNLTRRQFLKGGRRMRYGRAPGPYNDTTAGALDISGTSIRSGGSSLRC